MSLVKIVGAIIENKKGEFLIIQEEDSGIWKPPSETIKSNETPINAIIRGVKEETGYIIDDIQLIKIYNCKGFRGDTLRCYDYYARLIGGNPLPQKGEIKNIKLVNSNILHELMLDCPPNHHYGKQIANFFDFISKK